MKRSSFELMFRSGGDEPEVQLLGDDTPIAATDEVTERERSWWPVWSLAAVVVLVAAGAALTSAGGDGSAEGPEASVADLDRSAEVEAPATSTTTTAPPGLIIRGDQNNGVPDPGTILGEDVEVELRRGEDDETISAEDLATLDLDGYLLVWHGAHIARFDLSTGEWLTLVDDAVRSDPWQKALAATSTGFITTGSQGAHSYTHEGELIDSVDGAFSAPIGSARSDSVWIVRHDPVGPDIGLQLARTDDTGHWVEGPELESSSIAGFGGSFVSAGDRLFTSPFSGGIYEFTDAPDTARRVADGFIAAANADTLVRLHCAETLSSCELQLIGLDGHEVIRSIPASGDYGYIFDGAGWSPDLRYWTPQWGGSEIFDTTTGEITGRVTGNAESRIAWSWDSRWVASFQAGRVRLTEAATGHRVDVDLVQDRSGIVQPAVAFMPREAG